MTDKPEEFSYKKLEEKIEELDKRLRQNKEIDLAKLSPSERLAIIKENECYQKELMQLQNEKLHRN
ncbi:MAG: hypothetical protein V1850_05915 [Candidatus Bathyarchaeota archaeon]